MECVHEWQGIKDGVVCLKCGKRLSAEEYRKLTAEPKPEPKKRKAKEPKEA